jgi:diguanylate cyclase (GGDEF)-like protein/PAS domain S-box-containing protein
MYSRRLIFRHAILSLFFVLAYVCLNQPEVILISRLGSTAWYPATGLVMALLLGVNPWYAFLVALCDALAGALTYQQPLWSFGETFGAAGVAASYGIAAYLLRGPLSIDLGLRRRQDVVRYVFITSAAAAISTTIGVACLAADKSIPWRDFSHAASGWFLGDEIGLLGVAPFLLIHVFPWIRRYLTSGRLRKANRFRARAASNLGVPIEAIGQMAALVCVLWIMFALAPGQLFYLSFVPIIWIAMRQGIRRTVTGLLSLNFGIVVAQHLYPPTPTVVARLGLLMMVVSGTGLIVGSAVSERHRMARELHQQTVYLNSLIENSPLAIVVLNHLGQVELVNDAFEKLFLYDQAELAGGDLSCTFLPDAKNEDPIGPPVLAGRKLHTQVRRKRKDNKILDLEVHAVPLVVNERVQGALMICHDISEQLRASEAERTNAESLSRLVKELRVRTEQMALLKEMGDLLECSGTIEEASTVVSQSMQRLFPGAFSGSLYLFKSSRNQLEAAARWGEPGGSEIIFAPDMCWALRRGQPHWNARPGAGVRCAHLAKESGAECLCVPLVGQGDTLGILELEFSGDTGSQINPNTENLKDSTVQLASTVAGQVALSVASLRLRETLRDQSIRDPLTGLFNRRFMEESLERELQRAVRKNHPVSVLFLDLDHFKRFNDTYGHDAGDLVLRSIAEVFRRFFRADDVSCRYGGEEFAIILPESSAENAAIRAEGLRAEAKKLKLQYRGQILGTVTLSIGIAVFPDHATTAEDLLKAADQCLYKSKSSGRDMVTVAAHQVT